MIFGATLLCTIEYVDIMYVNTYNPMTVHVQNITD